jgi:hypothetical protein
MLTATPPHAFSSPTLTYLSKKYARRGKRLDIGVNSAKVETERSGKRGKEAS